MMGSNKIESLQNRLGENLSRYYVSRLIVNTFFEHNSEMLFVKTQIPKFKNKESRKGSLSCQ